MIDLYCDGGSRGNPGPAAYGFVVKKNSKTIKEEGGYIGVATNNVAEYTALVEALMWLSGDFAKEDLIIYLDSQLVVSQMSGFYKVKNAKLRELVFKVRRLEANFGKISYQHVERAKNKEADKQVNLALNARDSQIRKKHLPY